MRFVKTAESILNIPSGFQRVEYLESTGTQYIDTGFKMSNDNMTFDGNIMWTNKNATANFFFGYRLVDSPVVTGDMRAFFVYGASATPIGRLAIRYGVNADNSTQAISLNTKYNISWDGSNLKINGITYDTLSQAYTPASYKSMFLFWCNCENTYSADVGKFIGRIYNWQIKQDGVLVRDMIPCIDPLSVPCMYDMVGKKAYYNQGTGEFTVGRQIIPVEYLQSTGTQYIDTGLDYFADFEVGIQLRANVSNKALGNGAFCCMQRYNAANPYWYFTKGSGVSNSYASSTPITEHHVMKWKNNKIYSDDVLLTEFTKDLNTPNRMCLFGVSSSNKYPNVIYFCKLWNPADGTLVRDYIPCKDENDNGFMFDKVSGECYLNSGTGDFVIGGNKYKTKLRFVKDNRLPAGYTQVEYLESSGTQWIDTGIDISIANTDVCKIITDFTILTPTSSTGINAYTGIFGAGSPRFGAYGIYDKICFGYVSAFDNIQSFNFGQKYNLEYTVTKGSQEAKLDGASIWTATNTGTLTDAYKLGLFCRTQSTVQWIQNARIYNFKFYDNGTLICDYIPAIDSSGTPCMYDLVSRTPFYNEGTGTFTTGKPLLPIVRFPVDPVPVGYKTVNYLQSTGTQYIDTGFIPTSDNFKYEGNMQASVGWFFGYRSVNTGTVTGDMRAMFVYPDGRMAIRYGAVTNNSTLNIDSNKVYKVFFDGTSIYVNDVNFVSVTEKYNNPVYKSMYLFSANATGYYSGDMTMFNGKIYYFKIWDGNTLIRNFIPVVRLLDNKAGMWDTVTKQFYGNAGTGNFVTG